MANSIIEVICGILWFVCAVAILIKTYTWFTIFATIMPNQFSLICYWIGASILIILCVFIIPITLIIDGFKEEGQAQ